MDLNHLLYRHQIELMRADRAASLDAKRAHEGLADLFATRIRGCAARVLPPLPFEQRASRGDHTAPR